MKKFKVLFISIYLLFNINLNAAYNAVKDVEKNWSSEYSNEPMDVRIREADIEEATLFENTSLTKEEEQKRESKLNSKEYQETYNSSNYFVKNFKFTTLKLFCPPLKEKKKFMYFQMAKNINFKTGEITCNVYEKPFAGSQMSERLKESTPFFNLVNVDSKTFKNNLYFNNLQVKNKDIPSNLINKEAIELSNQYDRKLSLMKQSISYKYSNMSSEYSDIFNNQDSMNSDTIFLNLSQAIDAVMVFDTEIIDLEKSMKMQSLQFKENYIVNYSNPDLLEQSKERRQKFKNITNDINNQFNILPKLIQQNNNKEIKDELTDFELIVNSKLNMLIYFITKYSKNFEDLFWIFLFPIFAYALYSLSKYVTDSWSEENKNKIIKKFIFTGVSIFGILFLTSSITGDAIQVEDEKGNMHEIIITKIQTITRLLSKETGAIASMLSESVLDSYANTIFIEEGLSVNAVKEVAKEKLKYETIKNSTVKVINHCNQIYDTSAIFMKNQIWFNQNNFKDNPFIPENFLKKTIPVSIYNSTKIEGLIKNKNKFNQNQLSIDACYNAHKDFNYILRKIHYLDNRINAFNNIELKENIYTQKELMIEKLYDDYFKLGYIGISFINVVDTYQKIITLPQRKIDQWAGLIQEFDSKQLLGFAAENSILMLTIGEPVQKFVSKVVSIITDSSIGWIPIVGTTASKVTSNTAGYISAIIFVDIIDEFIPLIRGLFMFGISSIMFMLMFLAKFVVYWLLPFATLYALLQQSIEQTGKIVIKTILVFIKPIILIFIIFLTTFAMDFFSQYIYTFINEMTSDLISTGSIIEYVSVNVIKSFVKVIALVLEFVVAFYLLVKGTSIVTNFFEIQSNDLADVISDSVSQTIQQKVIK